MKLYEIADAFQQIMIEMEENELPEEDLKRALEDIQETADEKIDAISAVIKNLTGDIEGLKKEAAALTARAKTKQNNVDRLKQYLSAYLPRVGYEFKPFENERHRISFRKSVQVEVLPGFVEWAEKNAEDLLRFKDPEPDKTAIKEAINAGEVFDFARLVENKNIQIK